MSKGKYYSLEEARKQDKLDHFCLIKDTDKRLIHLDL